MDIKTRLENEELFSFQPNIGKKRIIALNNKGIFTIEDFLNSDVAHITTTSYMRKYYIAVQHILKYKYKGEPLVLDVLLDKEYEVSREKYGLNPSFEPIIANAPKLGFKPRSFSQIARHILALKMIKNDDYSAKNDGYKQNYYTVSIFEILKGLALAGDKLAQFYVEYHEKQELENKQQTSSETLKKIKKEIDLLTSQENELDQKIYQLEKQVQTLEGGNIVNGRKQH